MKKILVYGLMPLIMVLFLVACNTKKKIIRVDPKFGKYVEAYTSGSVSKKTAIRIRLAIDASVAHSLNEHVEKEIFTCSPSVKGKTYWVDARTIEFKPDKDLQPDEMYEVEVNLKALLAVPSGYETLKFTVQTIKPSFDVQEYGLRATGKNTMQLTGLITTADVEESAKVEQLLKASIHETAVKITWQHNEAQKTHDFVIDSIQKQVSATHLILEWYGGVLNSNIKDKRDIEIPAIGDFKVLKVRPMTEDGNYVLVQFSEPLSIAQMLDGLIVISNQSTLSYTIMGSEVKVYAPNQLAGNQTVIINEGIESLWSEKIKNGFTANIFFENRRPAVSIQGKGVILPNSNGKVVLGFEACNLKAVDITVVKIFQNNIFNFLKQNNLDYPDYGYSLRSVASPLVEATVQLDEDRSLDLHKNNRFTLDLDKYIATEPGTIYQVRIGFRPQYSLFSCNDMNALKDDDGGNHFTEEYGKDDGVDGDDDFWSRYRNDYFPYDYNYQDADNPCSKAYYTLQHFATRNILSSNIGLTAKIGGNNKLFVQVNNLVNTDPMSGVQLDVYNYQQQIVATGKSNSDGIAWIDLKKKPYLLVAKSGKEMGYLKLEDGSSLMQSKFDIAGVEVKNGIKAFVFGERGVWRPGDTLFLGCIVEDKASKLPKDHPIEMQLFSPQGQLYKKMIQTNAVDGFNMFTVTTDPEMVTGNWNCRMRVGASTFDKKIKIENVLPNKLKIRLSLNGGKALGKNANITASLNAKWLYGAPAQRLKARVDAQLYRHKTVFPKYEGYTFDNPTGEFNFQSKIIFDGTLNDEGNASINPNFDAVTQAPGSLLANVVIKVFEPGGNFSIDNIAFPYHTYSSYSGVKIPETVGWGYLKNGKTQNISLVNVNTDGELVANNTLEVTLYKIEWRWWWDSYNDLSNFTQNNYNKLISKQTITTQNGKADFSAKFSQEDWGRYLILVKDTRSGHTTGKTFYVDDEQLRSRGTNDDASAATMLSFATDKTKYNVGENVTLTIPSGEKGKALISIETGTKIIKTFSVPTTAGQTKFTFTTDKEMSPNVYISVSLIQPHAQTINDLPIRMYGVAPITVEDKSTVLNPVIKMPNEIKAEQKTAITVSESSGKKMSYVLAIVDDGLLDLTHFKTPDPHAAFFAKEALGVKSFDLYDYVIGAWGGSLERILSIGGDAEAAETKSRKAIRFKPVVRVLGPFSSDGSSKTHYITLPTYMGSVRVMVIAAGNGAYGMAEKDVLVKKPLMMFATLPRVLAPSEDLKIPVTVFITNPAIKQVSVSLQSNGLIQAATNNATVTFNGTDEQTIYFSAKVKDNIGIGKVKLTASANGENAQYETEIDIRNPNPKIIQVTQATLQPNQHYSTQLAQIGDARTSKALLEVSAMPAMNIQKRLNYLIEYPYGCLEQTTSAVFPQLFLSDLIDLPEAKKHEIDINIKSAITKIQHFQQGNGDFSYWPASEGMNNNDPWSSIYAGHFLIEAAARGYTVPSSMLYSWKNNQGNEASYGWKDTAKQYYGSDLIQAYRLYVLALARQPDLPSMNRLKEYKFLSPEGKWRLAAAYQLAGQGQVAMQLISHLPTTFPARQKPGISFGSALRDQAMVLETLTTMGRLGEAEPLVRSIAANLSQETWYSTQTTAYSLLALAKFSGINKMKADKMTASGTINGKVFTNNTTNTIVQNNILFANNKANIDITNNGKNVLYINVINEGKPLVATAPPPIKNNPDLLNVNVSYITNSGKPIDITKLKQGTDFVAKVVIKNPGNRGIYNGMALKQVFPSGWEIINTRMNNNEGAFKSSPSEYMDIKDDRVINYFSIKPKEILTFYVQLNAAYLGKFYFPGVYAEAMYDNTISGGTNGKWVEIVDK